MHNSLICFSQVLNQLAEVTFHFLGYTCPLSTEGATLPPNNKKAHHLCVPKREQKALNDKEEQQTLSDCCSSK